MFLDEEEEELLTQIRERSKKKRSTLQSVLNKKNLTSKDLDEIMNMEE